MKNTARKSTRVVMGSLAKIKRKTAGYHKRARAKRRFFHSRRKHRIFHSLVHFGEMMVAIALVLVIVIGAFIFRLSREPISLPIVSTIASNWFNDPTTGASIAIGQSELAWDSENKAVIVQLLQVKLSDPATRVTVFVPRLRVKFNTIASLIGRFYPEQITADGPVISIEDPQLLLKRIAATPPSDDHSLPSYLIWLQAVNISDIKILLGNPLRSQEISLPRLDFAFRPAKVESAFGFERHASARGVVTVKNLHPAVLAKFVPELSFLAPFDLPLSLELGYGITEQGKLDRFSFTLVGGAGRLVGNNFKMGELPITSFRAKAFYSDFSTVVATPAVQELTPRQKTRGEIDESPSPTMALSDVELVISNGPVLSGSALISIPANPTANRVIMASLAIDRIDLDRLENYWPLDLAADTRLWCVEKLHRGELTKIELNMRLEQTPAGVVAAQPPIQTDATRPTRPHRSGDWVAVKTDGSLGFSGTMVLIDPQLPPVTNASGSLSFNDSAGTVSLLRADMAGLEVLPSVVNLNDLLSSNPRLKAKVMVQGSLTNMVQLLSAPALNIAQSVGITAEQALAGQVKLNVEFELPMSPHAPDFGTTPQYHAIAKITGMKFERLVGNWGAEDSDLNLDVDNRRLLMSGKLKVEGVELNPEMRMSMDPKVNDYLHLTSSLVADMTALKRLKLDHEVWLDGQVPIDIAYDEQRNGKASLKLGVNLTNADFRTRLLPGLLISRTSALVGRVALLMRDHEITAIQSLNLRGPNAEIVIDGTVNALNQQQTLRVLQFKAGENQMTGDLEFKANGAMSVKVRGESLNLDILNYADDGSFNGPIKATSATTSKTPATETPPPEPSQARTRTIRPEMLEVNQPFEPSFPLLLDIRINRLSFGKERTITNAAATGYYDGVRWQEASVEAMLSNSYPLNLKLRPSEDHRSLWITAANSGEFIRIV
ncbi:MAG: DUF3971 domain-containing protein, partial [Alphaproteobacteria bacterium]|nr:DUF3971 domain-containing protein [Alphaproteobacteria bacterium]